MHVTAIEAALVGAAISAMGSTVTGLVIQRSTGTRDHLARLWERQAEAYEAVLVEITRESGKRSDIMAKTRDNPTKEKIVHAGMPKVSRILTDASLQAKLEMFGTQEVSFAFREYSEFNTRWFELIRDLMLLDIGGTDTVPEAALQQVRKFHYSTTYAEKALVNRIKNETARVPKRTWRSYIFVPPEHYT